jgi:molybdate transport system substrate-binding protein
MKFKVVAALAAVWLSIPAGALAAEPVTVFAAASLKNSLDAIDARYEKRTGVQVRASYAASSTLARQIEQGAPADVFISADADWMDYAAKHQLIRSDTRRNLLTNHLALIAPKDSAVRLHIRPGFPIATAVGDGKLALAGLDVPAGRYARASLTALGVWPQVVSKSVYGESVRAALAYVSHGEAPLGIVYDTDAKIDPGVRIVDLFPETSHPRIVYPAALTRASRDGGAAAYLAFIEGPEAAAIFRSFGFEPAR